MRVDFTSNVHSEMPWTFKPTQRFVKVVPGETALAFYTVKNTSKHAVTGVATYNVHPPKAGLYFNKIQCFCFEEQVSFVFSKSSSNLFQFFLTHTYIHIPLFLHTAFCLDLSRSDWRRERRLTCLCFSSLIRSSPRTRQWSLSTPSCCHIRSSRRARKTTKKMTRRRRRRRRKNRNPHRTSPVA